MYLVENVSAGAGSTVFGPRVESALVGTAAGDDDLGPPTTLRATWLTWNPTPPSPDVFTIPTYCPCH